MPDESPYGFHLAEEFGWRLIFSTDAQDGTGCRLLRRCIRKLLGFDLIHAWANRNSLRAADIVWTMTENEWLAARCLAVMVPSTRRPIIGNSVWLFDAWQRKGRIARRLLAKLARGAGVLTVHSNRYVPLARAALPGVRVDRMYFGIALEERDFVVPATRLRTRVEPLRVLAMGNDRTRDWDTFLAAFGNDPRFQIDLICSWVGQDQRSGYANLVHREPATALSRQEATRLYIWSDVVVVPMKENSFSGITSAIDACGRGKPVISTRTGGVPTYFDEGEVLYVEPGDAAALRHAALLAPEQLVQLARAGQARFRRDDYTSRGMVRRYISLSEQVLADDRRSSKQLDPHYLEIATSDDIPSVSSAGDLTHDSTLPFSGGVIEAIDD
ncbi:glycosyltransferase [uncultured Sphingomonas sp.]|uniref:glycosyltransferase n=1 Tax=uncultured Sphingomonas sp. TaxID=158754 RepID=UPI0035CCA97F